MQKKVMFKALSVLILAIFIMSTTAMAATGQKCKANPDKFSLTSSKYTGNVLTNDKGEKIKVISTSKTTNKGKVTMKTNGYFSYKPASTSKTVIKDTFTYTITDKYGQKSTAKVTINYKKVSETGAVIEVTKLAQINTSLEKGPVFLKLGAEWCGPCKEMKPILKDLALEYKGKAVMMSVDVDKSSKIADYFDVSDIPDSCVIVGIKDGKYIYIQQNGKTTTDRAKARILGLDEKEVFEKLLDLALK